MTAFATGRRAELAAAVFLERKGCRVIVHNWRTKMCEIDIVAERHGTLYFCEVKYRGSLNQGSGIDYITPKKLAQMRFAAESWVHIHNYSGPYQLVGIEVTGHNYVVTNVVRDLG